MKLISGSFYSLLAEATVDPELRLGAKLAMNEEKFKLFLPGGLRGIRAAGQAEGGNHGKSISTPVLLLCLMGAFS